MIIADSYNFKGLGIREHIETSHIYWTYLLLQGWILRSQKYDLLRLILSKLWGLLYAQPAWKVSALRVWLFRSCFQVASSSYIKLVRAVYKQRIYYYFIQFSGMLHCWLQRYHARIRTLGSSLVAAFINSFMTISIIAPFSVDKDLISNRLKIMDSEGKQTFSVVVYCHRARFVLKSEVFLSL